MKPVTVLSLLLVGLISGCTLSPAHPLDSATPVIGTGEALPAEEGESVYRARVDRDRLFAIKEPGRVADFLRLPDGQSLEFHVTEVEGEPPRAWRGRLHQGEQAGGSLTLSRSGDRLSARFQWQGETYRLGTRDAGDVLIRLSDMERPPDSDPRMPDTGESR